MPAAPARRSATFVRGQRLRLSTQWIVGVDAVSEAAWWSASVTDR